MADKLLKSIKFPTLPDRYVIGDTSLSEEGAAADAKATGDEITNVKSDIDDVRDATVAEIQSTSDIHASINWTVGYMAADGTVSSATTLHYSNKISVSEGDIITYGDSSANYFRFFTAFNGNTAISASGDNTGNTHTYVVPSGIDGVVFTAFIADANIAIYYTGKQSVNSLTRPLNEFKDGFEKYNIFDEAELLYADGYASIDDGKISARQALSNFNAYLIPVDGTSIYSFTNCRFAFLVDSDKETAIGSLLQYVTQVASTGASYICFSFSYDSYPLSDYIVSKGTTLKEGYNPPNWAKQLVPNSLEHTVAEITLPKYLSNTGVLSSNSFLALLGYKQSLRKGERYVFSGNITTITKIRFGFTYANAFSTSDTLFNEFTIDATNISYKINGSASSYTSQYAHGLTLTNNIQFVFEYLPTGQARITLVSNGEMFTQTLAFTKQVISQPVVVCDSGTLTDCKLSWTPIDIDKKVWLFGDSYIAYSSSRWAYYLEQFGYSNNVLLNGVPGEGSINGKNGLNSLIHFGVPKYIVWCMGMNDGSDTNASTPASDWVTGKNTVLSVCEANNITPVFVTIPNVPNILHTGKNAWVRASGYRYIDFAKAVGAEPANSTWYSGMLSDDNVHPTEQGAKALFTRVLLDFPEIMMND